MRIILLLAALAVAHARWIVRNRDGEAVFQVVFQTEATQVYKDELTLIWDYLGVWEPNPVSGYMMLGHKAQGDWEDMSGSIPIIKDLVGDFDARYSTVPVDLEEVWRDQGGFGTFDVAFWRPVCPEGFFSLGDIAYSCEWCGWPKPLPYLGRLRCLSEEMVEECSVDNTPLWTNDGGFENQEGSVWTVTPNEGVSTFWLGNQGWEDVPQNGRAYCLKAVEFEPDF